MKPDRIKFTREFSNRGLSEWIGIEGSLEENETPEQAISKARNIVIEAYKGYIKEDEEGKKISEPLALKDDETNKQLESVKAKLTSFEFREDAQEYLEVSGFKFNIEAKGIVNNKPLKNK